MDRKIRSVILCSMFATVVAAYPYSGKVVDESGTPLAGVTVILRNDSTVAYTGLTDFDGRFDTNGNPGEMTLKFRYLGYEEETLQPKYGGNVGDITMIRESVSLDGIAVVADNKKVEYDFNSFRLSKSQLERYSNIYEALSEIPLVTLGDELRVRGEVGVLLLINGVKASLDEFKAISKQDLKEIRVYDMPPARFSQEENVKNVIELITKADITGGNTYISLSETPSQWVRADNGVRSFYNYGRNRFSVAYNQNFNRSDKGTEDATITYHTAGGDLTKESKGMGSYVRNSEQNFSAAYMYSNPYGKESTQFNAGFKGAFTDTDRRNLSAVTYPGRNQPGGILSRSDESTDMTKFDMDMYFHRTFGPRHFLMANLVATTYSTSVSSVYGEENEAMAQEYTHTPSSYDEYTLRNHSDNRLYSLIGEVDYDLSGLGPGKLTTSGRYYWQRTRYSGDSSESHLLRNEAMLTMSYRLWLKQIFLRGQLAGTYTNLFNDADNRRETSLRFTPQLQVYWPVSNKVTLAALYTRTSVSPTAAQLTSQVRPVDKGYYVTGNPNLTSYASNYFNLGQSFATRYFEYSIVLNYTLAPGMIVPSYFGYEDNVTESLANAGAVNMFSGSLTLTFRPVAGMTIGCNFIGGNNRIKVGSEDWNIPTYRCNAWVRYSTPRWNFSASYQAPGRDGIGFMKRKRMQAYSIGAGYSPRSDMEVGLTLSDFFIHPVEEQWSVEQALVDFHKTFHAGSFRNKVSVHFSWNLSYGRRRIQDNRNISDSDDDSGLLAF